MYPLAHLGIGAALTSNRLTWKRRLLPFWPLLIGTLLPDLIDKPIYYGLSFYYDLKGADLGLISGTRTFGHTALFLILIWAVAVFRKSENLLALGWGIWTHLLVDNVADLIRKGGTQGGFKSLLWPLLGWQFPVIPYHDLQEQLGRWMFPTPLLMELLGLILLIRFWRQRKKSLPDLI